MVDIGLALQHWLYSMRNTRSMSKREGYTCRAIYMMTVCSSKYYAMNYAATLMVTP